MVTEWLPGAPIDGDRLRADPSSAARALRAFHDSGLRLPVRFWVPDLLADYAAASWPERGGTLPGSFTRTQELVARIAEVAAAHRTRPLSRRPAARQRPRRGRRPGPRAAGRLGVRRHGSPLLRPRQPGRQQRVRRGRPGTPARGLLRSAARAGAPGRAAADDARLRRPRGGVGRGAGLASRSWTSISPTTRASTSPGWNAMPLTPDWRSGCVPRPRDVPDRARVVIIGGGVGGASIAYHLAQLGERDVVLVDRNELTSGSTFHSAGLVGQLRGSVSLTRMMMDSVALYRTLDCGWVECGGIRLACTEEREQEVMRQVAWSRTFGLPLELLVGRGGPGAVPADGHRRRALRVLPAHRRLPRPVAAHLRARRRRPARRLPGVHPHAGARRGGHRGPRARRQDRVGRHRGRGRGQRRRHVRRRDRPHGRGPGAGHPVRARVPGDPALSGARRGWRRGGDRAPAHPARPRQPHLLPRGGRGTRDGRLRARERAVVPGRARASTASRRTSTGGCWRRTGRGSRRSPPTRPSACPPWRTSRSRG